MHHIIYLLYNLTTNEIIDFINRIDLPVLLAIFGFVGSVILWGIIKNR